MTIRNLTPHNIVIYDEADCTPFKCGSYTPRTGARPLAVLASEGVARAATSEKAVGVVKFDGLSVPVLKSEYGKPVGLPEPEKGVYLIVSALTAQAAARAGRATSDLLVIAHSVRDAEGNILGCTRFATL